MDAILKERLTKWHEQVDVVHKAERLYLTLLAHEKPTYSSLYLESSGSIKDKEAQAFVDQRWMDFKGGLVEAEIDLNNEKRILAIKQKAYEACYLEFKINNEALKGKY